MSDYNREQRHKRIAANNPNVDLMIMDPSEEWIFTDSHWEEYNPHSHGAKTNVRHKDFDEAI